MHPASVARARAPRAARPHVGARVRLRVRERGAGRAADPLPPLPAQDGRAAQGRGALPYALPLLQAVVSMGCVS